LRISLWVQEVRAMYCSACGQPIDAYQPYCPRCGRQATPIETAPPPPWIWTRVHRHVHTVGILWIVLAGLTLLNWMFVVPFLAGMTHNWPVPFSHNLDGFVLPFEHMPWLLPIITAALLVRALLCAVTGIVLLRRASWARIFAIVVSFLMLIHPPFGTALGIYTLWVLLPALSGQEYERLAAS
jgi:hypothetical protein